MWLLWKRWRRAWVTMALLAGIAAGSSMEMGCAGDACHRYFQELKSRCRLGSSAEGAKLDQYLERQFSDCQLDICNRTSVNSINCADPNTFLPGGLNGRFDTCQD